MCKLTSRRSAASMLRQRGFTLLEMSVAATLGAMLTVGALLTVQFNGRLTEGRIVGEHMPVSYTHLTLPTILLV